MPLEPWGIEEEERVADMGIFGVSRLKSRSPRTGRLRTITRLESGGWVNVIALTPKEEVVLVRQYRHGTREMTLEIPGGLVDEGEAPDDAATRELLEETGYAGSQPVLLGVVSPNPAILDNRCHTYLIRHAIRVADLAQDEGEDIEVGLHPLDGIPGLIAEGAIHHALVICAFWWLAQAEPGRFTP